MDNFDEDGNTLTDVETNATEFSEIIDDGRNKEVMYTFREDNNECLEEEKVKSMEDAKIISVDESNVINPSEVKKDNGSKKEVIFMFLENLARNVLSRTMLRLGKSSSNNDIRKQKAEKTDGGKRFYIFCVEHIFAMLDLFLLTAIIVSAYFMYTERKLDQSPDIALSLPCKVLQIHPDDVIEGMLHTGENNETCRMNDTENYAALMTYFVDHWLKEKIAEDDRRFTRYQCRDQSISGASKPYIKLVGRNYKQTGKHDNVLWDGRSDAAILSDDKDFDHHEEHGFIEIKQEGVYQVYSQVVLNHDNTWYKKQHKANIYGHFVIRIAAGRSESADHFNVIMKTSNTFCSNKTENQIVTSYLNGAFRLLEGDKVAVKVLNKTEIVPDPNMNFFGVHML